MRNKIIAGLTTAVVAVAIAAPAAHAQAISPAEPATPTPAAGTISPAQPTAPANLQPAGPSIRIGSCVVKHSHNGKGYTYAVCPINADNIPSGQSVTIRFKSSLKTFKPRTIATWANQSGTYTLANQDGMPGTTSNMIG